MHEAGLHTWTDAVANVHGRIQGQNPDSPVLLIGSHYDTVKDAGKYDGALGILAGIAAVKGLVVQVRAAAFQSPHQHSSLHAAVLLHMGACPVYHR